LLPLQAFRFTGFFSELNASRVLPMRIEQRPKLSWTGMASGFQRAARQRL